MAREYSEKARVRPKDRNIPRHEYIDCLPADTREEIAGRKKRLRRHGPPLPPRPLVRGRMASPLLCGRGDFLASSSSPPAVSSPSIPAPAHRADAVRDACVLGISPVLPPPSVLSRAPELFRGGARMHGDDSDIDRARRHTARRYQSAYVGASRTCSSYSAADPPSRSPV